MPAMRSRLWPIALFVLVFTVHTLSGIKQPGDAQWTLHAAMSLLAEGNLDLAEYADLFEPIDEKRIDWVDGRPYNFFPLGPSLWAMPVVALLDGVLRVTAGRSYATELRAGNHSDVQEICASLAVAWAAVLLWALARELGLNRWRSVLLVVLFAFGTSVWSSASRALYQHGPSLVCLGSSLLLLVRAERRDLSPTWAALPLGLSFLMRPTNAVPILVLSAYVLWRHRRRALGFVAVGVGVAAAFAGLNLAVFGRLLPPYYEPGRLEGERTLLEALVGNLVSPSRGLLVFTPALVFSISGWRSWRRDPRFGILSDALVLAIGLHWLVISSFPHWWAGWSYGPRLFTDMVFYFCFLLIPVVAGLGTLRTRDRVRTAGFLVCLGFGMVVHGVGANLSAALDWNGNPNNIDQHPARLWDWRDPQFLRWRFPDENPQLGSGLAARRALA